MAEGDKGLSHLLVKLSSFYYIEYVGFIIDFLINGLLFYFFSYKEKKSINVCTTCNGEKIIQAKIWAKPVVCTDCNGTGKNNAIPNEDVGTRSTKI